MVSMETLFERRRRRTRFNLKRNAGDRVRLSVFRSNGQIYAQVIDDSSNRTVAFASSLDKELKLSSGSNIRAAAAVGELVAKRALQADIKQVVFDRGGYTYHGRVKALAEAARQAGLSF